MLRRKKEKKVDGKMYFPAFFTTPEGRAILKEIDKYCDYGRDVFNIDSERVTAYNQGRQNVAIWIRQTIEDNKHA